MKQKRKLSVNQFIIWIFIIIISPVYFISCTDKDLENSFVGTWKGSAVRSIDGEQQLCNLTLDIYPNGSGGLLIYYCPPNTYEIIGFTKYKTKGDIVTCVSEKKFDKFLDSDVYRSFKLKGNKLIPLEQYEDFILTKVTEEP